MDDDYSDFCWDCGNFHEQDEYCSELRPIPGPIPEKPVSNKLFANVYVQTQFREAVKAYNNAKTENTISRHNTTIENLLAKYGNLDQLDTRKDRAVSLPKPETKNYIEIKQGGITFRKAGDRLTIVANETMDYTDLNVLQFTKTLEQGLSVIAAAAKFDTTGSVTGVTI